MYEWRFIYYKNCDGMGYGIEKGIKFLGDVKAKITEKVPKQKIIVVREVDNEGFIRVGKFNKNGERIL